jgi:hypothetical protein
MCSTPQFLKTEAALAVLFILTPCVATLDATIETGRGLVSSTGLLNPYISLVVAALGTPSSLHL